MRTIQQSSAPNFFFCFNLILLFTSLSFPQSVRDEIKKIGGSPQFNKSFTPLNLPIDTTTTSVFFYGEALRTKVAKDSGGVSVRPYMRVWADSNDIVIYGDFNDSTGWEMTSEWTISGGTANYDGTGASRTLAPLQGTVYPNRHYNLSFDITTDSALIAFRTGILTDREEGFNEPYNSYNWYGNGSHSIQLESNSLAQDQLLIVSTALSGGIAFSIDNVELIRIVDSTYGYTHTIIRPSDNITYFYSQSVWWRQKDKDTIWLAAETDTVTVYPYVAPEFEEGAYTSDGNELYTIDGNRIYAKQEGE